ncbi:MAG: NAD(P)-dependent oxidoreductase [Sphingobium sp.]|nr:NAD(P)-dependent oxidoreductase [Sphingobium sp.]
MAKAAGFIGLGNMGDPFCCHLRDAGYELHLCEVREDVARRWTDGGATLYATPKDLADAVDTVFLSLPTPDVVESVVLGQGGLLDGKRLKRVVDLSTTGPDMVEHLAKALREKGVSFIDAPVSGGVAGARAGTVAIMLACGDDERDSVADMLTTFGRIYHVGKVAGLGQVTKILNNLLSAGSLVLTAEVAAMGAKAGLEPKVMIDVFNAGSGRSSATLDKYVKAILPGTFQTGFTNRLMYKDVSLCLALAEKMGLEMPASEIIRDEWRAAMKEIGEEEDFSKIVLMRERAAGVEVRNQADG